MGVLLDRARAVPRRPTAALRISEFAASGRLLRVRSEALGGAEVYFAADNADTSPVPPDAVIFYPDELAQITDAGPAFLQLLWETKRLFDPHGRTHPENDTSCSL